MPATTPKGVAILGSTGSVGRSALDLIKRLNGMPSTHQARGLRVVVLAAHRNVDRSLFRSGSFCLPRPVLSPPIWARS